MITRRELFSALVGVVAASGCSEKPPKFEIVQTGPSQLTLPKGFSLCSISHTIDIHGNYSLEAQAKRLRDV